MSQNIFAFVAKALGGGAAPLNVDANGSLVVALAGEATTNKPIAASSGNVANAAASAGLVGVAGVTNYIAGLSITGAGATAASVVTATVTGLAAGPLSFTVPVPAGVDAAVAPLLISFNPPLPASAADTKIAVNLPALGAGNTNAAVSAWGFQQ